MISTNTRDDAYLRHFRRYLLRRCIREILSFGTTTPPTRNLIAKSVEWLG